MTKEMNFEAMFNKDFFQKWVDETFSGDFKVAEGVLKQAIILTEDFEADGGDPFFAMLSLMFAQYLVAAKCGMDTENLKVLIQDQSVLMWDAARYVSEFEKLDEVATQETVVTMH